jgi:hypothetical protein
MVRSGLRTFCQSCDYLLQMMTAVDLVKAPPLLCGERAKHGMVE